jgi:AraC-like DNA-binding protein
MSVEDTGAYGARLAETFGMHEVPAFVTRTLHHTKIAVTHIRCDRANNGLTAPLPHEDAFLATLQLQACPAHELWLDGRQCPTGPLSAGTTCFYDLRTNPVVNSLSPFRNMHFYLPRQTLNNLAEQDGFPLIDDLAADPGRGVEDGIIAALGLSLESAFDYPDQVTQLFVDHVTVAMATHVTRIYGTRRPVRTQPSDALSACQEGLVKDMLEADLQGNVRMEDLAAACGMGLSAFRRAFVRATGMFPHQWLLQRRVERARDLIRHSRFDLQEIARLSGFADLAHMERVFRQVSGLTPDVLRAQ